MIFFLNSKYLKDWWYMYICKHQFYVTYLFLVDGDVNKWLIILGRALRMNSHVEHEQCDIKYEEDSLSISDVKIEPEVS